MSTERRLAEKKPPLQPGSWFHARPAGITLHATALPGGHLGSAPRFIEFLAAAGIRVWQTLPLGPVNESLSPYQPLSLRAGNTALLDRALLIKTGLLAKDVDIAQPLHRLCGQALARFAGHAPGLLQDDYAAFRAREADWLEDHALFLVLARRFPDRDWTRWPRELREREPRAMDAAKRDHADELELECFMQWLFRRQWNALREQANRAGIIIFGDLPIYPSLHSADVWLSPELFQLDVDRRPINVSGTPPDAFSATGQVWGTPLYAWEAHEAQGFQWWLKRLAATRDSFDVTRIDHFRGLAACWAIPATAETAAEGRWQKAPGKRLLQVLADELPELEIVVEDLGHITPDVRALRDAFGLPGMAVLQFGFDGRADNPHHPDAVSRHCVYYTDTHDNETITGWWKHLDVPTRKRVAAVTGPVNEGDPSWPLLRPVFASRARLAVAQMQDFLSLGNEARFNLPGTSEGNWRWRLDGAALNDSLAARIREFLGSCGRSA